MYWWSHGYKLKPLAEVLAVHPTQKADVPPPGGIGDARLPLAVHQFVGSGRCLFFGFDETWRWRFRDEEVRFNKFWVQTLRFLSQGKARTGTDSASRSPDAVPGRRARSCVTVRFPENMPFPKGDKGEKTEVKVRVEYRPNAKGDEKVEPEEQWMNLTKIEGSLATFEDQWKQTREGKYKFRLFSPNVPTQEGEKPSAEATVELPPGELDRLRMNQQEMTQAADQTQGRFLHAGDRRRRGPRRGAANPPPVKLSCRRRARPTGCGTRGRCFCGRCCWSPARRILQLRKHLL